VKGAEESTPDLVETLNLVTRARTVVRGILLAHDRRKNMTDWEVDERGISECLKDWRQRHNWRVAEAAFQLRLPLGDFKALCTHGLGEESRGWERQIRRMMVLIDGHERAVWEFD
jgi:hypothetical protein